MNPKLHLVLKSGGDYKLEHVDRIRRQLGEGFDVAVLTDCNGVAGKIPLLYGWPGWWSKLELCRPDIVGDVFYVDLDSTIVGDLTELASVRKTTMLSDFYRPEHVQSSVMMLTQNDRRRIWQAWIAQPYTHMDRYKLKRPGFNGDQNFIEDVLGAYQVQRYQDVLPGQVLSFKVDILNKHNMPDSNTRLICFHGKPRPWQVTGF